MRGKSEASCHDRRLHLDLSENGNEGSRLQPFLKRPGRVRGVPRLNDEDKRGVEAEGEEPQEEESESGAEGEARGAAGAEAGGGETQAGDGAGTATRERAPNSRAALSVRHQRSGEALSRRVRRSPMKASAKASADGASR